MIERSSGIVIPDLSKDGLNELISGVKTPDQAREAAILQKDFWARIPTNALHANGRTNFEIRLKIAYVFKLWQVNKIYGYLFVDTSSGQFIVHRRLGYKDDVVEPAKDEDIEKIILPDPEQLNAQKILKELRNKANGPNLYPVKEQIDWRIESAGENGILEDYFRLIQEE